MTSFTDLGISKPLLKAIAELGFETPSEIQLQAIPQLIEGDDDLIGLAQTGTGKTAAFGLPILELIDVNHKATQALILAPTRELGQQIAQQLSLYSKYQDKINVLPVYGGANISTQIKALRKTQHVIIATPGRLIDLIKRKSVKLGELKYLVLDEADEMLNMGFKEEIDRILSYTPDTKRTWLFSATMPKEIKRIVNTYMENPIEVKVNTKNEINANIEHQFAVVTRSNKTEALTRFIDANPQMRTVVFCRTKRDTQALAEDLLKLNYKADALHGDLSQSQRDRVMKRFKEHDLELLIATDVAARGIDVNDLTHVIHFSLPDTLQYYTHRSGRTARAGKKGISIAFINGREKYKIAQIERQLSVKIEQVLIPDASDIAELRIESWAMNILNKKTKGKIDQEMIEKIEVLFGNLSKEELLAKMLMTELEKINLGAGTDLNKRDRDSRNKHHKGSKPRSGKRKNFKRKFKGDSKPGNRRSSPKGKRKFKKKSRP